MARRRGETPLSQQIANHLRDAIQTGEYPLGALLPSQRRLAADHNIAHNTAREALLILVDEGLVTARHGKGFIVRAPYVARASDSPDEHVIDATDLTLGEADHLGKLLDDPAYTLAGHIFLGLGSTLDTATWVDSWWVRPGSIVIEWAGGPPIGEVLAALLPRSDESGVWSYGVPGLRLVHEGNATADLAWLGADDAKALLRKLPSPPAADG